MRKRIINIDVIIPLRSRAWTACITGSAVLAAKLFALPDWSRAIYDAPTIPAIISDVAEFFQLIVCALELLFSSPQFAQTLDAQVDGKPVIICSPVVCTILSFNKKAIGQVCIKLFPD